jgi:hypothetical protein
VDERSYGAPLLSIFVADGAGSAAQGGAGAELAMAAATACLAQRTRASGFGLDAALAAAIVQTVRERIAAAAAAQGLPAHDFACTFLAALSNRHATLVCQIGDGAVVLDTGAGLQLAIEPMSGEYANMTRFVTDEDALTRLETRTWPVRALKVAAFTDGLERLALNLTTLTPHEPFFAPFFAGLAQATPEQQTQLPGLLLKFLGSPAVNERTDDDKTLALAVWA